MQNAKEVLREIIDEYGIEIIQNKLRLNAMISDLLHSNTCMKNILELSIKADIPKKMKEILDTEYIRKFDCETDYDLDTDYYFYQVNIENLNTRLTALKLNFKEDYFLEQQAVESVFKCWEDAIEPYPEVVSINDYPSMYKYKDCRNNFISENIYDKAYSFCEGLAAVGRIKEQENEYFYSPIFKYGFINRKGIEVIPLIYENVESFSGGFVLVVLNGKRGYIDRDGKWVKDEK